MPLYDFVDPVGVVQPWFIFFSVQAELRLVQCHLFVLIESIDDALCESFDFIDICLCCSISIYSMLIHVIAAAKYQVHLHYLKKFKLIKNGQLLRGIFGVHDRTSYFICIMEFMFMLIHVNCDDDVNIDLLPLNMLEPVKSYHIVRINHFFRLLFHFFPMWVEMLFLNLLNFGKRSHVFLDTCMKVLSFTFTCLVTRIGSGCGCVEANLLKSFEVPKSLENGCSRKFEGRSHNEYNVLRYFLLLYHWLQKLAFDVKSCLFVHATPWSLNVSVQTGWSTVPSGSHMYQRNYCTRDFLFYL